MKQPVPNAWCWGARGGGQAELQVRNSGLWPLSLLISTTVEQSSPREALTPQLTNINHMLKGKAQKIALRFGAGWETHDSSIWPRPLASSWNGQGPFRSSCMGTQPGSVGRDWPRIHSHKLYMGISKHTHSTIKGLCDSHPMSGSHIVTKQRKLCK